MHPIKHCFIPFLCRLMRKRMMNFISRLSPQDIIYCDDCEKPSKEFCNSCQVSLCKQCSTKHRDEFQSLSHDIVSFRDKKIQLVSPECHDHAGKRCEVYCKQCYTPVCALCLVESHKGHDGEKLTHETRIKEIEHETQEIQNNLVPHFQKISSSIERIASKCEEDFQKEEKLDEREKQIWIEEVINVFNRIGSTRKSDFDEILETLEAFQNKIKSQMLAMTQKAEQNKNILEKSNDLSQINTYKSNLMEFKNDSDMVDLTLPVLSAKRVRDPDLCIEINNYKATLTQIEKSSCSPDRRKVALMPEEKAKPRQKQTKERTRTAGILGSSRGTFFDRDELLLSAYGRRNRSTANSPSAIYGSWRK